MSKARLRALARTLDCPNRVHISPTFECSCNHIQQLRIVLDVENCRTILWRSWELLPGVCGGEIDVEGGARAGVAVEAD